MMPGCRHLIRVDGRDLSLVVGTVPVSPTRVSALQRVPGPSSTPCSGVPLSFCIFDKESILTAMDRTANSLLVKMSYILTADRPVCLDHTSPVSLRENKG